MSQDISNKTLIAILAISIIVSISGTLISLNKLNTLQGHNDLTGFATNPTGVANITIESEISIILDNDNVYFGSGKVNTSISYCADILNGSNMTTGSYASLGTPTNTNNCWTVPAANYDTDFIVRNIGNEGASVVVKAAQTVATWLGGDNPKFQFESKNSQGNGCSGSEVTTWTDITTSDTNICATGELAATNDAVTLPIHLFVPANAAPGYKHVTLTFTAS